MKTILRKGYLISDENIKILSRYQVQTNDDYTRFKTDTALIHLVDSILQSSITEIDYNLNWKDVDSYIKFWFLYYILRRVQEAPTYKEVLKVVYNQHSFESIIRNSILLMINLK